jgi:DNA-binding GntR family transcriptional regulator
MTFARDAYEQIRQDLVRGKIPAGQHLRLAQLRDQYDVGFSPLREALTRLAAEHLVIAEAQRGFRVAPLSLEKLRDTMNTRIFIETEALRRAIELGDDAWETGIVSSIHTLKLQARRVTDGEVDAFDKFEKCHFEFHRALIVACGSTWLTDFFSTLYAISDRYRIPALRASFKAADRDIEKEHMDIANAALARNANLATRLLEEHYVRTTRFLEEVHDASMHPEPTEERG